MCIENCGSLELSRCKHELDGNINRVGPSTNESAAIKSNFVWSKSGRKFMGATVAITALASLLTPGAAAPAAADIPTEEEVKASEDKASRGGYDKPDEPEEPSGYEERQREKAAEAAKAASVYSSGGPTRPAEDFQNSVSQVEILTIETFTTQPAAPAETKTPPASTPSTPTKTAPTESKPAETEKTLEERTEEIYQQMRRDDPNPYYSDTPVQGKNGAIQLGNGDSIRTRNPDYWNKRRQLERAAAEQAKAEQTAAQNPTPAATKPAATKPAETEKTLEERTEEIYQQMRRDDPNPYYSDTPVQGKNGAIQLGNGDSIRTRNPDYWNKRRQLERAAAEQAKAEQTAAQNPTPAATTPAETKPNLRPVQSRTSDAGTEASNDLVTTSRDEVFRDGSTMQTTTRKSRDGASATVDEIETVRTLVTGEVEVTTTDNRTGDEIRTRFDSSGQPTKIATFDRASNELTTMILNENHQPISVTTTALDQGIERKTGIKYGEDDQMSDAFSATTRLARDGEEKAPVALERFAFDDNGELQGTTSAEWPSKEKTHTDLREIDAEQAQEWIDYRPGKTFAGAIGGFTSGIERESETSEQSPIGNSEVTWETQSLPDAETLPTVDKLDQVVNQRLESANIPVDSISDWQRQQLRQEASGGLMLPGVPINTDEVTPPDTSLDQSVGGAVTPSGEIEWSGSPTRLQDSEPVLEPTAVEVKLGDNKLVGEGARFSKNGTRAPGTYIDQDPDLGPVEVVIDQSGNVESLTYNGSQGKRVRANIDSDGYPINQVELPSLENSSSTRNSVPFGGGVTNADGSSTIVNPDGTLTTSSTDTAQNWGFNNGRAGVQDSEFETTVERTTDRQGNPIFTVIRSTDPKRPARTFHYDDSRSISHETIGEPGLEMQLPQVLPTIDPDKNQGAIDRSNDVPWGVNPRDGKIVEVLASYKPASGSDLGPDLDVADADQPDSSEADFGEIYDAPGDDGNVNTLDLYLGYENGNDRATPSTVAPKSEAVRTNFGSADGSETNAPEAAALGGSEEDQGLDKDAVATRSAAELVVGVQASVAADNVGSGPCIDNDGDGWGWNGASCAISDKAIAQQAKLKEAASKAADEISQKAGNAQAHDDDPENDPPANNTADTNGSNAQAHDDDPENDPPANNSADMNASDSGPNDDDSNSSSNEARASSDDSDRSDEAVGGKCVDTDGDGWGWNGASCKM